MARRGQKGWICTRESNDGGKTPRFAPVRKNVKDDGGKKARFAHVGWSGPDNYRL